jgi:integrative and conjugative element protein (TIGR02256 family)
VVWLPVSARDTIVETAAGHAPRETGGVVLGYETADADALVITHTIGGGPEAMRSRSEFVPDGRWQEGEIARIYRDSSRRATYLGDWHSHPAGVAAPSRKDQRTAARIAAHGEARAPRPLMLIVAKANNGWRIAAYRFDGKRLRRVKLEQYRAR